jgi:hypothetical protein
MTTEQLMVTIRDAADSHHLATGRRPTILLLGRDHIDALFSGEQWASMAIHGMQVLQHNLERDAIAVAHNFQSPHEAA